MWQWIDQFADMRGENMIIFGNRHNFGKILRNIWQGAVFLTINQKTYMTYGAVFLHTCHNIIHDPAEKIILVGNIIRSETFRRK